MPDPATIEAYAREAGRYAEMAERLQDPLLEDFIAALPRPARVIDLGCGPGHAARRMAEAGLAVTAIDASPEMVRRAAGTPGVTAIEADFAVLADRQRFPDGCVEGVWASFSLLHLPHAALPGQLEAIARVLASGGLLHLVMKLGEGEMRDALGRYYALWPEERLVAALNAAGLALLKRWHGRATGLAGVPFDWIAIRARAGGTTP